MKTVFTYAHVKWFLWPIRARVLFELFYKYVYIYIYVRPFSKTLQLEKCT